jgi:exopolyphosphatase/guanosine-5'-triphosphate,3'-diphosphate pyrophosphatase
VRLGRGLERSGELNVDGVAMALDNLGRFLTLATVMGAERIDLLATAAVRDADNGAEFVRKVEKACGRACACSPARRRRISRPWAC